MLTSRLRFTIPALLTVAMWSSFGPSAFGQLLPFGEPFLAPTNDGLNHLVVHDFDGDGLADIGTAGPSFGQVLFGDRTSLLRSGPGFHTGSPWDLAAGDLNEDGFGDVTWVSAYGTVYVNFSDGSGGYQWYVPLEPRPGTPAAVEIRDCNGDGHLDVAAASAGWLGGGDGTLVFDASCSALEAVNGDFDGDAWPDRVRLAVEGFSGEKRVKVARGVPGGGYGTESDGPLLPANTSMGPVADVSGDGLDDILFRTAFARQVAVVRATGSGAFADPVSTLFPDPIIGLGAADFDGDGRIEVGAASVGHLQVHFLRAAADSTLTEYASLPILGQPYGFAFVDLTGDGAPEMLVGNHPSPGLWVYPNRRGFLIDVPTLDPRGLALLAALLAGAGWLLLQRAETQRPSE